MRGASNYTVSVAGLNLHGLWVWAECGPVVLRLSLLEHSILVRFFWMFSDAVYKSVVLIEIVEDKMWVFPFMQDYYWP